MPAPRHPLAKPLVVVVGPTASGKTELAQRLALHFGGSVMSADSMQVYRGLDIGTGKIAQADMMVPHGGIDIADIANPFSAALYQAYARPLVEEADSRGETTVVCGGTGFYVRALVDDYEFPAGEQVGNDVRDEYMTRIASLGAAAVWAELQQRDPDSAALIHPHDEKRVVRAFEMLADGTSYARQHAALPHIAPYYPAAFIGLAVDPAVLRGRIDARIDDMFRRGLVDETAALLQAGLRDALTASRAIGYTDVIAYLEGRVTLDEAMESMRTATHRYAKRQRTWFRKDARIRWIEATDGDAQSIFDRALIALDDAGLWARHNAERADTV